MLKSLPVIVRINKKNGSGMFSLIMHMCITCNTGKKHPEAESDMMQCSSNVLELDYVRTA